MEISTLLNLKKILFLPYLRFKLGKDAKIRYVHLKGAPDAHFGCLNFST